MCVSRRNFVHHSRLAILCNIINHSDRNFSSRSCAASSNTVSENQLAIAIIDLHLDIQASRKASGALPNCRRGPSLYDLPILPFGWCGIRARISRLEGFVASVVFRHCNYMLETGLAAFVLQLGFEVIAHD